MNFKIFPATVIDDKKIPLIKGWQENATNDPNVIHQWQQQFGDRITMWGIPTGKINGIYAVDIDVKGNVDGNKSLQDLGISPEHTAWQRTNTGGLHLIYQYTQELGNTVDRAIGIDTRGEGGWIAYYGIKNLELIKPIPNWIDKIVKRKVQLTEPVESNLKLDPNIMEPQYQSVLVKLSNAGEGERNHTLNTCAYMIGQMVQGGGVDYQRAYTDLTHTALKIGLDPQEIQATVMSGLKGGVRNPITHPFGNTPPQLLSTDRPVFEAPEAPEAEARWTPTFATIDELQDYKSLKRPQLFKDWQPRDIILTSAIGGVGKTTLALYQAACLALAEPFLGFENVESGKTLFIAGEDSEKKLKAMLGRICKSLGLFEPDQAHRLERVRSSVAIKRAEMSLVVSDPKTRLFIPNQDALNKIYEAVDDLQPKQIVIDPLAMFWGSESGGNDMAMALAKAMQQLLSYSDASIEMIAHIGKDSSSKKDTSQFSTRGGTALPNHSRVVRTMLRLNDDEYTERTGKSLTEGQSAIEVHVSKFSDGSPVLHEPFIIVRDGFSFFYEEITLKVRSAKMSKSGDKESSQLEDDIYNFIKGLPEGKFATAKDIAAQMYVHGHSGASVKAALRRLNFESLLTKMSNPSLDESDDVYIIRNV